MRTISLISSEASQLSAQRKIRKKMIQTRTLSLHNTPPTLSQLNPPILLMNFQKPLKPTPTHPLDDGTMQQSCLKKRPKRFSHHSNSNAVFPPWTQTPEQDNIRQKAPQIAFPFFFFLIFFVPLEGKILQGEQSHIMYYALLIIFLRL